jgi:hypothetical protein
MSIFKKIIKYLLIIPCIVYQIPSYSKDTKEFEPFEPHYNFLCDLKESNKKYKVLCSRLKKELLENFVRKSNSLVDTCDKIINLHGLIRLTQPPEENELVLDNNLIKIIATYLDSEFFIDDLKLIHPNLFFNNIKQ